MLRCWSVGLIGLILPVIIEASPIHAGDLANDVVKVVPKDTEFVIGLNLRQIVDSTLGKKYSAALALMSRSIPPLQSASRMFLDLSIDPLKDIDRVLIAVSGSNQADKGLYVLSGRFDVAKITAKAEDVAKRNGVSLKTLEMEGNKVYEVVFRNAPSSFVALAGKTTILISPNKDQLVDALSSIKAENPTELVCKDLKELLPRVDFRQALWFAASGPASRKVVNDDVLKQKMIEIRALSGGISLADDIKLAVLVATESGDGAKNLVTTINSELNAAKTQPATNPRVAEILSTIKITVQDATVSLKAHVTADVIEKATKTP